MFSLRSRRALRFELGGLVNAWQIIAGFLLSALIAVIGYRARSLAPSGVGGALLVGTATFGLGGWVWGLLLIAFFVTASALSHYRERDKAGLAEKFAKGGRRDLGQALANGGMGALLAVASVVWPQPWLFAAFVGAMAAVNADTWATELGVLNPRPPRLVTTGHQVPVGTSGAVSPLGLAASFGGALLIGLLALAFSLFDPTLRTSPVLVWLPLIAAAAGLASSLFDSLLGATVQAMYLCPTCSKETESAVHRCGTTARRIRGWRWLDNDGVNFASSVLGSAIAAILTWIVLPH